MRATPGLHLPQLGPVKLRNRARITADALQIRVMMDHRNRVARGVDIKLDMGKAKRHRAAKGGQGVFLCLLRPAPMRNGARPGRTQKGMGVQAGQPGHSRGSPFSARNIRQGV